MRPEALFSRLFSSNSTGWITTLQCSFKSLLYRELTKKEFYPVSVVAYSTHEIFFIPKPKATGWIAAVQWSCRRWRCVKAVDKLFHASRANFLDFLLEVGKVFTLFFSKLFFSKTTCWIASIQCSFKRPQYKEPDEKQACLLPLISVSLHEMCLAFRKFLLASILKLVFLEKYCLDYDHQCLVWVLISKVALEQLFLFSLLLFFVILLYWKVHENKVSCFCRWAVRRCLLSILEVKLQVSKKVYLSQNKSS